MDVMQMRSKVNNKAQLLKNRRKFVQLFTRNVAGLDVPVLNRPQLQKLLKLNRQTLGVTQRLSLDAFIEYLTDFSTLKVFNFEFPHHRCTRYALPDVSLYAVVSSFFKKAYFTHYSALYLQQLTEQIPKKIYLNLEQVPKPAATNRDALLQANIDQAFRKPQRTTNNLCVFENHNIFLLNGKFSNNEGVEKIYLNDNEKVMVTGIERTLIDISVRPTYSGGVQQVLSAFEKAKALGVSINRLSATLKRLNYIYPYHQVIGFYLEKAGYSESQIAWMDKLDKDHDFYLDYNLKSPDYSERWRLFIPQGF